MAITYDAGTNLITLTGDGINPAGGTSWANAYDMEGVLASAGAVVTKQGANAYDVSARMKFESGVYFVSTREFVELRPTPANCVFTIRADAGTHIRIGEYNAVDGYGHSGAFWQVYLQSTTGTQQVTGNRLMGEFLLYGSSFICDSTSYQRGPHLAAGATARLYNSVCKWSGYFWAPDCDMQDIKFHGGGGQYDMLFATGYDYSFSGVTSIGCYYGLFFSSTTNAPVDVYNQKFQNCTYDIGLISTTHPIRVINSPFTTYFPVGSGKSFSECYQFNVKVTDDQGNAKVGATVSLKDVDGNDAFTPVQTIAGGVLPADEIVVRKLFRHANQGGNKDYNDHTLKVTFGADETEYKIKIDHKITEDVVLIPQSVASYDNIMAALDAIQGTGFVEDTHSLTNIEEYTDILDDATNGLAAIKAEVEGLGGVAMRGTDGVPTNPLLDNDVRIGTIAGDVAGLGGAAMRGTDSVPTNPLLTNDARLDNLDAAISSRADENPPSQVLNDYKADVTNLDAAISSRAIPADVTTAHTATDALIAALNDITVADIFNQAVEGAMTFEEFQRIMYAALINLSGGGGTPNLAFRDVADTKDRIQTTVTLLGDRIAVVVDGT